MTPEEMQARLLYRDGLMLVIDKPAGVAVHRGPKGAPISKTISTRCVSACRASRPRPPPRPRHRRLPGARAPSQGARKARPVIQARQDQQDLLGDRRRRADRRRRSDRQTVGPARRRARLVDEGRRGRPTAKTAWRVCGRGQWRGAPIAWLELTPLTGRTHQLRVHCASEGWPILGDPIYGARADLGLQLLARGSRFPCRGTSRRSSSRRRRRRICVRRWRPAASPASPRRRRPPERRTGLTVQ